MSFGLIPCGECNRLGFIDHEGEVRPLETCYSNKHSKYLCRRCLSILDDEIPE